MANKKIQIIPPDGGYVDVLHPETSADQVKLADANNNFTSTNVEGAMSELFQNVSNGKNLIATSITGKGISTSGSDSFSTMATKIGQIETDKTGDATAVAGDLISGKTAYAKGSKITGTMSNRGTVSKSLAINGSYTIPSGYHSGSGKVTQSITTKSAQTYTPTTTNQTIASGRYLSGTQTIKGDSNLISSNIVSGKSIFGVSGSAISGAGMVKYATGTVSSVDKSITVTGIGFRPSNVIIKQITVQNTVMNYVLHGINDFITASNSGFLKGYGVELKSTDTQSRNYQDRIKTNAITANGFSTPVTSDVKNGYSYKWYAFG